MTNKKMTIAFIGNGKSANRYHIPFILTRQEKITIKTIYARHINHDVWDALDQVHYTDSLEEVLNDPEIDACVIVTPSSSHYELAKKCLEAGKSCVVDKPFTHTYQEAQELFDLAREKGLVVECYQNRRFDSDFLTTQSVIESGKLGDLLEVEMHYDYFRPEVPESIDHFDPINSYLYGHACHTLDQVISYFGKPEDMHYDVRQLLGEGRFNDYFDIDLYYQSPLKVSVKSSYFRIKERPSFVVYGKKGMFVKAKKDRQEEHLKVFYMPSHPDFGLDRPEDYGTLTYVDDNGIYHEEKVPTIRGDYARYYDAFYETIMNHAPMLVKEEQTLLQIAMLEEGVKALH